MWSWHNLCESELMNINNKFLTLIMISLLLFIVVIITIFGYDLYKIENQKGVEMKMKSIIIRNQVINTIPINQTQFTSLVSNTESKNNKTLIYLTNGLSLEYNGTDIKSGDSISLNTVLYKFVCSKIIDDNNLENNTIGVIIFHEDSKCNSNNILVQVLNWTKLNQK